MVSEVVGFGMKLGSLGVIGIPFTHRFVQNMYYCYSLYRGRCLHPGLKFSYFHSLGHAQLVIRDGNYKPPVFLRAHASVFWLMIFLTLTVLSNKQ